MKREPDLQPRKNELRSALRAKRAAVSPSERQRSDASINQQLLALVEETGAEVVAVYVAFDGEPDLGPALADLAGRGVRIALPVIAERPGRAEIEFRQWLPASEMQANRYGIPEPQGTLPVRLSEIDLALLPLVGWDDRGGRLGMGASFYDRLFEPLAEQARPLRVGVAYAMQQVERVPVEPWDIRLHRVLTESGCLDCESGEPAA